MDGAVDPFDGLPLALGHREQLILLGVGHAFDRFGLTCGLEYLALLDPLGPEHGGGLGPFGFGDLGSSIALCLHLTVHGVGDVGRRLDPLELDPDHAHAPLVGGVVEDLAELGVDHLTGGQGRIEIEVADHVPQVGLGELGRGQDEVAHVVLQLHRVGRLVVDDGIDGHHHVVLGDHLLWGDIDHLLPHVDLGQPLHEGHHPAQTRVHRPLVATEELDEPLLEGPDDSEPGGGGEDQHQRQHGEQDDHSLHVSPFR